MALDSLRLSGWLYGIASLMSTLTASSLIWILGSICEEDRLAVAVSNLPVTEAPIISPYLDRLANAAYRNDLVVDIVTAEEEAEYQAKLRLLLIERFLKGDLTQSPELTKTSHFASEHHLIGLSKLSLDISILVNEQTEITAERIHAENQLKTAVEAHSLIALDVSELLSLPSLYETKNLELRYYKNGILANLPMMKGIPDGIHDVTELRDALETAGGKVKFEDVLPEQIPKLFNEKLESLRSSSAAVVTDYTTKAAVLAEIHERLSTSSRQIVEAQTKLRELTKQTLITLSASDRLAIMGHILPAAFESL